MLEYLSAATDQKGATRPFVADLGGTLPGTTTRDMARAMGALHAMRPSVSRYVAHAMLRWDAASGDAPGLPEQADMMAEHVRAMGFEDFRMFSHGSEVHAIASRIRADGSVVDERNDWRTAEHSVRALEIKYGLRRLDSSPNAGGPRSDFEAPKPRPITQGEMGIAHRALRDAERQGRGVDPEAMPKKPALADAVLAAREAALLDGATVGAFVRACHRAGVEVRPNMGDSGRVSGLSFFLADAPDVEVTGSKLSRGMSWANLLKGGLSYEHVRDGAELREARERAARLRPGREAGRAADPGDTDVGRPGHGVPPLGRDDGGPVAGRGVGEGADGGHARPDGAGVEPDGARHGAGPDPVARGGGDLDRGPGREAGGGGRGDGAARQDPAREDGREPEGRGRDEQGVEGRRPEHGPGAAEHERGSERHAGRSGGGEQAPLRGSGGDGLDHGPMHERLVGLAGVQDVRLSTTLVAVGQAVGALGAPFYVVAILPPRGTPPEEAKRLHTLHRTYSAAQLSGVPVVKYLRAMNAQGHDIYFKPAAEDEGMRPPLVMVDDLPSEAVARMKSEGFEPALGLTSSPGNHQVWVKVGDQQLAPATAREAARYLAHRYGGDLLAAKSEQFGRLPGFTNRKPKRIMENGGRPPFARVVEAVGSIAARGAALVRECVSRVRQEADRQARLWERKQAEADSRAKEREGEEVSASVIRHMQASAARQGAGHGLSEVDFAAACGALRDGHAPDAVASALRDLSPGIEQRHPRVDDYVRRTVEAAARATSGSRPKPP